MSSLGIFDKETKTYKKVADLSKPAVIDSAMSDTSTNPVQNKVVKSYVDNGVNSSKKLQTYKQDSTTETYGDSYNIYAQWRDGSHVKIKCDNYTVETDYATSANNASTVNGHTVNSDVPSGAKFTDTVYDDTGIQNEINTLKKSVSDGKTKVANAITDKGVETATDATFAVMANNISQIETGVDTSDATATAAQILTGQTAYVNGNKVTGSMANRGAVSHALNAGGSYTISAGYHNGNGKVTANSLASQTSANATAADIASGKTAWVNGNKLTGTMSPGKKYAYGSCSGIPNTTVTVRNYPSILASINTGIKGVSPELVVVQLNSLSLYFEAYIDGYNTGLFHSTIAITDKGSNKIINPTPYGKRDARFTIDPVYNSNTGLITLNTSVYFELGIMDPSYLDQYNIQYYANSLNWYLIY